MDHVPAGGDLTNDTTGNPVHARRSRMRAHARGLHEDVGAPSTQGFQTPQWLERSFVLPLTKPEMTDVPSQPVPHHDDDESGPARESRPEQVGQPVPAFVRPPSPEIDFARVIRRADTRRTASLSAMGATGLAGVLLIVYLLTSQPIVLGMAIAFAVVAVVAVGARVRLSWARIPHLEQHRH